MLEPLTLERIAELRRYTAMALMKDNQEYAHLLDAAEAHLKQTAAPARPEGLLDALQKIAFWLPVVGYEANETRFVNIEEVFTIKRLAADALERALAEKAGG